MRSTSYYLGLLLFLASCAGTQKHSLNQSHTETRPHEVLDDVVLLDSVQTSQNTISRPAKREVVTKAPSIEDREIVNTPVKRIPSSFDEKDDLDLIYTDKLYKHWVNYFSKRSKKRFIRHLKRGEQYRDVVSEVFKKHGLPADLFYVGLIESGFRTHAKSSAQAVGPWQFVKGTAVRYGLKVNRQVDERKNILKATEAAANYFKDLYNIFGSWELALCAYNAGEYRIIGAIRKGNTRDYIKLVEKKLIPKETIYYIPKVAAARMLSKQRRRYNIPVEFRKNPYLKSSKVVSITRPVNLKTLAKKLRVNYTDLKGLNTDYRTRWIKASSRRPARIVVPGVKSNRLYSMGLMDKYSPKNTRSLKNTTVYKVKRGDNLSLIAKRADISLADLKAINKIKRSKIYVGQKLVVPQKRSIASTRSHKIAGNYYTVRRGDTLSAIANRSGVSVRTLKKLNYLRNSKLLVGQNLKLRNSKTTGRVKSYTVKRGDNLFNLARRFKTTVRKIISFNRLRSKTIYLGQKIRVPVGG